ncbi:hypothetical protein PROFUN_12140 [Planoprotostelium fungivorum]|uniref:Uncharacterized protein n=1 Tax=Planoprotostelium fungivorum TaxID=1890364 RepID=A0A2P6N8A6_9EUKA|nr:hypothetical protein PROFUN_12140 [Planoprotostelium fungivorum]
MTMILPKKCILNHRPTITIRDKGLRALNQNSARTICIVFVNRDIYRWNQRSLLSQKQGGCEVCFLSLPREGARSVFSVPTRRGLRALNQNSARTICIVFVNRDIYRWNQRSLLSQKQGGCQVCFHSLPREGARSVFSVPTRRGLRALNQNSARTICIVFVNRDIYRWNQRSLLSQKQGGCEVCFLSLPRLIENVLGWNLYPTQQFVADRINLVSPSGLLDSLLDKDTTTFQFLDVLQMLSENSATKKHIQLRTCRDGLVLRLGVSRPVLSLTKPQDETKTRQTSLVSDRLETVSVLFFLFLGDTGNEPFARPRTKSREGGKDEKNLRLVNKSDLSLSPFDFITHNCHPCPKRVVPAKITPSRMAIDITSAVTSQTWLGYHRKAIVSSSKTLSLIEPI